MLITGDDASLVGQALDRLLDELVADGDRSMLLEEVTETHYLAGGDAEITPLITAARTPPFLTDKRIVVGRNLGLFTRKEQVTELVDYLADPSPTTELVLVWERGSSSNRAPTVPKSVVTAVKEAGGRKVDAAPSGRGRKALLDEKLTQAAVRFDTSAKRRIADHLGDDVGQVEPLIELLVSTFGEGAALTVGDVEPFLGQASDVPPWELTDAIDAGDIPLALEKLGRMFDGGERHPLQVLATLHGHYQRALALDGAGVSDEREAAAVLGMKGSTFPAKKALTLSRRLRGGRIQRIVQLLGDADLDVRGRSGLDGQIVLEVLVARLARASA